MARNLQVSEEGNFTSFENVTRKNTDKIVIKALLARLKKRYFFHNFEKVEK